MIWFRLWPCLHLTWCDTISDSLGLIWFDWNEWHPMVQRCELYDGCHDVMIWFDWWILRDDMMICRVMSCHVTCHMSCLLMCILVLQNQNSKLKTQDSRHLWINMILWSESVMSQATLPVCLSPADPLNFQRRPTYKLAVRGSGTCNSWVTFKLGTVLFLQVCYSWCMMKVELESNSWFMIHKK